MNITQQKLDELQVLVDELNADNSSLYKRNVLAQHSECRELLRFVYDPLTTFGVTSKNILKHANQLGEPLGHSSFEGLKELLNALIDRRLTGHEALGEVWAFTNQFSGHRELIFKIIDRNLQTRADAKMINKVWPGLIPEFNVALANKYADCEAKVDFRSQLWFGSQKLDGVRLLTLIDGAGEITFMSRKGKEFWVFEKIREALKPFKLTNVVLDGEACIINKFGEDDFQAMLRLIRRKDYTVEDPRYMLFDMIPLKDFQAKYSSKSLSERWILLRETFGHEIHPILRVLPQIRISEVAMLNEYKAKSAEFGWEGLILRLDTTYNGKRSNELLKVKEHFDSEYDVQGLVMGPIRWINPATGLEETTEMLSSIDILHKDSPVSVGSGFSMEERKYYYENPQALRTATVTVRYTMESKDETGKPSLRFPRVKAVHIGGRKI